MESTVLLCSKSMPNVDKVQTIAQLGTDHMMSMVLVNAFLEWCTLVVLAIDAQVILGPGGSLAQVERSLGTRGRREQRRGG
jgi:hypothetical protein